MSIESYRQSFFSPPSVQCPAKVPAELCQIKCSLRRGVFARDHYQARVVTAILTIRETDAVLVELDIPNADAVLRFFRSMLHLAHNRCRIALKTRLAQKYIE